MARILVVDDEPAVRSLMSVTLKLAGHDVTEASGGEEALKLIEKTPYDVIVLDIMMPVTDGYEVLQRLRAMSARADTPVIVATAKGYDAEGMLRESSGGAVDHLSKPFDPEDLESAVARILESTGRDLETRRRMHTRAAEVYSAIDKLRSQI
ncbi:MAG: response regulator [Actinomycetota bacterium]|nr:response regulator [Actinomycetota bacterium]